MPEPLSQESVEFVATGLEEIVLETKKLEDAVKSAYAQQMALNAKLNDPVWRAQRDAVDKLAAANRQLADSSKRVNSAVEDARESIGNQYAQVKALNTALKDPATLQRARDTAKLAAETRKLLDIEEKLSRTQLRRQALTERSGRLRSGEYLAGRRSDSNLGFRESLAGIRERRAALASGQFGREVLQANRLKAATDRLAAQERKVELQATHGRLAAGAMLGLERARPGMLAAGAVGAVGLGMARGGLSGTVEGNALSMEMHLLNRELAGAILPAVKDLTRALRWVRQKAEKLTGGQQDALGYGVLAAGGLGAVGLAAGTISTAIGGLGKMLGAVGLRAGGGAAASVASQALASGVGTAAGNVAGGAAGGAAAGGRMAALARFGPYAGIAYGAYHRFESGAVSQFMDKPGIGSGLNLLADAPGARTVGSGINWGLTRLARPFVGKEAFERMEERRKDIYEGRRDLLGRKQGEGAHRTPLIADAGFEDFDTAYQRVATATTLQAALEREPGGKLAGGKKPEEESAETLKFIFDLLKQFAPVPTLR